MTNEAIQIAVAQEMGWTNIRMTIKGTGAPERKPSPHGYPPGKKYEAPVTDYPNNINACIALCDALASEGWRCELNNGLDTTWECIFKRYGDTEIDSHYGAAATMAGAICEAFLRVRGKWIPWL